MAVRKDLKLSKGKTAAQVAHAVLGLYKKANKLTPLQVAEWELNSWPKIVLQAESMEQLELLMAKADSIQLPYCYVADAGRTEVRESSEGVGGARDCDVLCVWARQRGAGEPGDWRAAPAEVSERRRKSGRQ